MRLSRAGRRVSTALRLASREAVREEIRASWQVSLPSPELLAWYDEIAPGTAERILCMAEQSAMRTIQIEERLAKAEIASARRRLRVTFGMAFLAFAAAVVSFALGNQVAGVVFVTFSVAALIRSFISAIR